VASLCSACTIAVFWLVEFSASSLYIEEVRCLFGQTFRMRPMAGSPWFILLIEELELIVSRHVNTALKHERGEQHIPERLIVGATFVNSIAHA
jgi:hypothetical protein